MQIPIRNFYDEKVRIRKILSIALNIVQLGMKNSAIKQENSLKKVRISNKIVRISKLSPR